MLAPALLKAQWVPVFNDTSQGYIGRGWWAATSSFAGGGLDSNTVAMLWRLNAYALISSIKQGAYLSDTTKFSLTGHTHSQANITGLPDSIAAKPTRTELTTLLAGKQVVGDYLAPGDSTILRNEFLKNADSTTLKAGLLKNADSTTLKAGLLKNADSTTMKLSLLKNADSTTLKGGLLKNADSTTMKLSLLKNADSTTMKLSLLKNADSTTMKNSLIQKGDSTKHTVGGYATPTQLDLKLTTSTTKSGAFLDSNYVMMKRDSTLHSVGGYATPTQLDAKINTTDSAKYRFLWSKTGQGQARDSIRFIEGTNITLTQTGNTLTIAGPAGSGEANTASNKAGSGVGLFASKSGVDLTFKRLKATGRATVVDNTDSVTVNVDTTREVTTDGTQTISGAKTITGNVNGLVPYTYLVKSADTAYGAVAFVNLGELVFTMAASGFYEVEFHFFMVRATAATGYTVAFNFPQSPTNTAVVATGFAATAAGTDMLTTNLLDTSTDSLQQTATTVTTGEETWGRGWILNTSSTTYFQFRWHAETAANVTMKRGSYLMYRRLF